MFGPEIIEVATFRGHHEGHTTDRVTSQRGQNGMLLRDNIFGSIEEDAQRRDFTINSLYYSVADFTVRDYVGGMKDLQDGVIRLIGNPETRYREDPVRMLRAVRFAAKLDMTISPETAEPLPRLAALLHDVPPARLFEEVLAAAGRAWLSDLPAAAGIQPVPAAVPDHHPLLYRARR